MREWKRFRDFEAEDGLLDIALTRKDRIELGVKLICCALQEDEGLVLAKAHRSCVYLIKPTKPTLYFISCTGELLFLT